MATGKVLNRNLLLTKDAALYIGGVKVAYYDKVNNEVVIVADIQADPGSIGTAELADEAVTTAKIADDAVDATKLLDAVNSIVAYQPITITGQSLPAPTGSNQLNQDLNMFFCPPELQSMEILAVYFVSDTGTSGSDATSQYQFEIYNVVAGESLSSATTNTADTEITANSPYAITVDQNQVIESNEALAIRVDILDDGSPNPTDLNGAKLNAIVVYRPLT